MQSRKHSLIESTVNIVVGYSISVVSQIFIFPLFGINISILTNMHMGLYFTVVSLCRSYIIRRWFNSKQ